MNSEEHGFTQGEQGPRVRSVNHRELRANADFVLYWMIAARRPFFNSALDRAIAYAGKLNLPLVILEPLRCDYPWASDRFHRFVIDGMEENRQAFAVAPVTYCPYVEPAPGTGRGLVDALAERAAVVITDDFPCFFLPQAVEQMGRRLAVALEAVDGNGILPMSTADRPFSAAVHFRRHLQQHLREVLRCAPSATPFKDVRLKTLGPLPKSIRSRWPSASTALLRGEQGSLDSLPIDHEVSAVAMRGGWSRARRRLRAFVSRHLSRYAEGHKHPDDRATSRLSPYLHFGHIGAHEVFSAVMKHEGWSLRKLGLKATGQREGWWGVGAGAEAFLDQLVVWRELGFNTCAKNADNYENFESVPNWAQQTLAKHLGDLRPHLYSHAQLERAETHDPLWNAAQREMLRAGWCHNYMRMLWGKKILEWSPSPQQALATMIAIMNRWSLDGRDPSSYSGYMWTLGKYDRPWPEREVFGTVRSMSSANTAKKVRVKNYLRVR